MTARRSPEERFWSRVRQTDSCWEWAGAHTAAGYTCFSIGRKSMTAHRFAYELLVGPIPEGLQLDHLCRNRGCVRPSHMEPVTIRENVLRGVGFTARYARATHCIHGHEFTPENTYLFPNGRGRSCRTCRDRHWRAYRQRQKDKVNALAKETA